MFRKARVPRAAAAAAAVPAQSSPSTTNYGGAFVGSNFCVKYDPSPMTYHSPVTPSSAAFSEFELQPSRKYQPVLQSNIEELDRRCRFRDTATTGVVNPLSSLGKGKKKVNHPSHNAFTRFWKLSNQPGSKWSGLEWETLTKKQKQELADMAYKKNLEMVELELLARKNGTKSNFKAALQQKKFKKLSDSVSGIKSRGVKKVLLQNLYNSLSQRQRVMLGHVDPNSVWAEDENIDF